MASEELLRETLTERMRAARDKAVVALQSYNLLRSKVPDTTIIALEGDDDTIYYSTMIKRIDSSIAWTPLVCSGKDKVLSLRVLLARNSDPDSQNTFFIIDRDFDHLKGHEPGADLYCTEGYSFENSLVSREILIELLCGEFKCSPHGEEIAEIAALYESRMDQFLSTMEFASRALHWCRLKGVKAGSVDNRINKFVRISLDEVAARYDFDDLEALVGLPNGTNISSLDETKDLFDAMHPLRDWRGKFIFAFFVEFLARLQEDRTSKEPRVFKRRRVVTFNPKSSVVRNLSSIAPRLHALSILWSG